MREANANGRGYRGENSDEKNKIKKEKMPESKATCCMIPFITLWKRQNYRDRK